MPNHTAVLRRNSSFATIFRPSSQRACSARANTIRPLSGSPMVTAGRRATGGSMLAALHGVESATLLRTLAPDRARAGEHDFVLSSFPVFFCRDVVDYSELMNLVSAPHGTWRERLDWIKRVLECGVRDPPQSGMFLLTGVPSLLIVRNPLP